MAHRNDHGRFPTAKADSDHEHSGVPLMPAALPSTRRLLGVLLSTPGATCGGFDSPVFSKITGEEMLLACGKGIASQMV